MRKRDDVLATLRERIVNDVHFGRVTAGDRLTSATQLASELDADARVVRAAYEELEREGMVTRLPGSRGYFASVGGGASGAPTASAQWIVSMVADGIARGISVAQFIEHANRGLGTVRLRAACIECNDDQLGWLCSELSDDYGFQTTSMNTDQLPHGRGDQPEIDRADILVTTVPHATEVQELATILGKPVVLVTLKPEVINDVARRLRTGPVYFICTDPRFATKLRTLYRRVANAENIRPLVLGTDDPLEIPEGAPAWVMRTAEERMGGVPPHIRPLSVARIFSSDTRERLLSHLVRANLAAAEAMRPTR